MEWKFNNDSPIYSQLINQFKLMIASGKLLPGEKLDSVRDLASAAGVNPNTMQRAFQELERCGLVYTQRSQGRYVTEETAMIEDIKKTLAKEYLEKFLGSMTELGFDKADILALIREEEEK